MKHLSYAVKSRPLFTDRTERTARMFNWIEAICHDSRLSHKDVHVAIKLQLHFNRLDGDTTFISQGRIANEIGSSRTSVNASMKKLLKLGYIREHRTPMKSEKRSKTVQWCPVTTKDIDVFSRTTGACSLK